MKSDKTVTPSANSAPASTAISAAVAKPAAKPAKKVAAKSLVAKPVVAKKAVGTSKAAKATVVKVEAAKVNKEKKIKMVRDSVSMPKTESLVLVEMKTRAKKFGVEVKKTEVIRAGIKVLAALSDTAFIAAIRSVPNIKTGRPAKGD